MYGLKHLNYYRKPLEDIGIDNNFLNRTPVAQEIRARIDKWDASK
jgi:hypothetical protein